MRTDAIVIGAGIVGAACAYELARQGLNVQDFGCSDRWCNSRGHGAFGHYG